MPAELMDEHERLAAAMKLVEDYELVITAVAAYKAKAVTAGFSEHSAEEMAVDFHGLLLAQAQQQAQ